MRSLHISASVSRYALIRIEAEHPIELQIFASRLQQQSTMSTLGNPPSLDVRFPQTIGHV